MVVARRVQGKALNPTHRLVPWMDMLVARPLPSAANILWSRPGFLIRRLHQIHSAMFMDACREFGMTPLQYSVLSVVAEHPGLDQASLAQEVGIDRSNAADVMQRLQRAGLIRREAGTRDRRTKSTFLTDEGTALLERIDPIAREAHSALVETLPDRERNRFVTLLQQLVSDKNDLGRAPLKIE
jgi:DNA-binding MarR family transcriptional regulator